MHKDIPSKHLLISSVILLLLAYFLGAIIFKSEFLSIFSAFFFGILGILLFGFAFGSILFERKKARVLAAKELFTVSVISFVVGFIMKGYFGAEFQLLGTLTFLFSLYALHREKTTKKK